MEAVPATNRTRRDARPRLLGAALTVIREKGFAATSIDDLCQAAGVTKGAFFHHFPTKDELGVAAAEHWSELNDTLFAGATYHSHSDPLRRVLGYIDFRSALLGGAVAQFTCLVGTMVQEVYKTSPAIRTACEASICGHTAQLEPDLAEAMRRYRIEGDWTARSLALHTQAVLQGAFILAKATGDAEVARASVAHLRRYIGLLFG